MILLNQLSAAKNGQSFLVYVEKVEMFGSLFPNFAVLNSIFVLVSYRLCFKDAI
jgi:hypothetical protein